MNGRTFWMLTGALISTLTGVLGLRPAHAVVVKEAPWPYVTLPVAEWRAVALSTSAADAATAQQLLKVDDIGLPARDSHGARIAWVRATALADGALSFPATPEGTTLYAVMHLHNPLTYRSQAFRFRITGNKRVVLLINGTEVAGRYDAQQTFTGDMGSHKIRGMNRIILKVPGGSATTLKVEMTNAGDVRYFSQVPPSFDLSRHVGDWKTVTISNGLVTAQIAKPDVERGYYRGNRFEQAVTVTHLTYAGHTYFLAPKPPFTPTGNHRMVGPSEEFFDGIAWDDAKDREPFIKVGVGLFEKPVKGNNAFNNNYWPVKRFPWKMKARKDQVEFRQVVDGPRGWGYRYIKRLLLVPGQPCMRLEHEFTNTGTQTITAEQYCHNWVVLDKQPIGKGYSVTFPYQISTEKDYSKTATITGNRIDLLSAETTGVRLGEHTTPSDNTALIRCAGTDAAIKISGDFPTSAATLYFETEAVCYEPFFKFTLAPGETVKWTRMYEFIAGEQVKPTQR
ncbi:MAG TPA: hypothetical protein VGL77_15630 [Armatimonadota bacterium]|jgi:hypothetical protein